MGLVSKPTTNQLMIGDFIREKNKRMYSNVENSRDRNLIGLKSNTSDGSLIYNNNEILDENYQIHSMHRRHTSKCGERDDKKKEILDLKKQQLKYNCFKSIKIEKEKINSGSDLDNNRLLNLSKISSHNNKARRGKSSMKVHRDRNKSYEGFITKIESS
mmetsp:Transcript_30013/g.26583  ORF Transcript_30013/g.26583 Transcript_30013/m.26583 type:complete len:159 (+) Transcript_30013:167-643(+)